MNEFFLHYVWRTSQFDKNALFSTSQEPISILKTGFSHQDGGPDFSNARIKIDGRTWAGQVEIHVKSSEWYAHNHHKDLAYDNTILHVVYECDREVFRSDGSSISCIELKNRILLNLEKRYTELVNNSHSIPCETMLRNVPNSVKHKCLESMAFERVEEKTKPILKQLEHLKNDWSEIYYQEICKALGLRINQVPFGLLAKQLPQSILAKHKGSLFQLEALLFGTAGFLSSTLKDEYGSALYKEYNFLQSKYQLSNVDAHLWKFLRLRPANFPTIRIAQLAQLVYTSQHLFSKTKDHLDLKRLYTLFDVQTSEYWLTHYSFGSKTDHKVKALGKHTIDIILINAVIPVFLCYANHLGDNKLRDQVVELWSAIKPEKNKVTRYFEGIGLDTQSALDTQGLLQLNNKFCTFKNCLNCQIGHFILKQE